MSGRECIYGNKSLSLQLGLAFCGCYDREKKQGEVGRNKLPAQRLYLLGHEFAANFYDFGEDIA